MEQTYQVETAQHVAIEYRIASVGDRIAATLLDVVFLFVYWLLVAFVTGLFIVSGDSPSTATIILFILPILFYDLLCEVFLNGQTFGKMIMKTKVLRLDGSQPSFGAYFLRWLLRLFEIAMTSGAVALVAVLFSKNGQRLGDMAAGTTVVKLSSVAQAVPVLPDFDESYQPVFPQAAALSDDDIATIKDVLTARRRQYDADTQRLLLLKTQQVIQRKLGIHSPLPADEFLKTIVKDHAHLTA